MHTTNSLLDAFKATLPAKTDTALAEKLGVTRQRISQYRRGSSCLCDERVIEIANRIGEDENEVLLQIWAERAQKGHQELTFSAVTAILRRMGVAIA